MIRENLRLNDAGSVRLVEAAVSDSTGTATLHLSPDTNTGSTALWQSTRYRLATQNVPKTTLDELFDRHDVAHADLVKMDIEGAEYEAILGSPDLFTSGKVGVLALEVHPRAIQRRGLNPRDIDGFLLDAGYIVDDRFENTVYRRCASRGAPS